MNRFQILKETKAEADKQKIKASFNFPPLKQMERALQRSPDCYCEIRADFEKGIKDQWFEAYYDGRLKITDGLD